MLNPFTQKIQNYPITPGQVANVPQGWWHYEIVTSDKTHLLAIFDAHTPEVIYGSDILRLTPPEIMAHTCCLNEPEWEKAVSPIRKSTVIGPDQYCGQSENTDIYDMNKPYQPNTHYPNDPIDIVLSRYIGDIKGGASLFDKKSPSHWRKAFDHYGPVPQLTLYIPSDDFFE